MFSSLMERIQSNFSVTFDRKVERSARLCVEEVFFEEAPKLNPNVDKIKGVVCGVRVEEIEDPLMQKIRWMDKRIDELARGKAMEKILRQ